MFQFSGFPACNYGFITGRMEYFHAGFPIQTSTDRWICAPPRGFSQLVTSFIGSRCQGIRPVLFLLDLAYSASLRSPVYAGLRFCDASRASLERKIAA